ncbi:MAG: DEAD/DEAH box helicase family protein [Clostridia bacterium]|nr:DEAD/DEAH box helicase family protein [Clostridia bacterium]
MPSKLQMITELSNETTKEITKSPSNWLKFLDTASNNYKYPFNDQILIYAQRPDAKVCAEMETWNRRLHRWIQKGSKGIALLQNKSGYISLRHVFDIEDTYDKFGRTFNIWSIPNGSENQVIESLENSFGTLEFKDNLEDAIVSSVRNSVEDNIQDYLIDFKSIIEGSLLEEYDDFNLDHNFKNLMINSISYMMLKRCGYDPMDYFDIEDFSKITEFNTIETISRFGIAMSDIAEVELHEIYTTVLDIQKNKKRTFEYNQSVNYDDINNINESKIYYERSNEEYGDKLSQRRGLYDTQPNNRATEESSTRQMGENENEIHSGEQERSIYGVNDERNTNELSSGDRPNSNESNRADSETISTEERSERGNESEQSTTMDWSDEQLQESSRGDSYSGTDIQLNLFDNNKTQEEQMSIIETLAEVENTPAFSLIEDKQQDTSIFDIDKNFKINDSSYIHIHTNEEGYYYDLINQNGEVVDGGLLEYSDREFASISELLNELSDFTGIQELKNDLEEVSDEFIEQLSNEQTDERSIETSKILSNNNQEKMNFHITNNQIGEGTPKEKVRRNIEAIELLKKLENENRLANKDEQEILANYIGWGGLPDVFDESKTNWSEEYQKLKELLTDEEYKSARASTLTAFFTPPIVISSIYKVLQNMGFEKGNILEPSCGVGNFMGMLPSELDSSKLYGIEIDDLTGRIAKQLYQKADIQIQGYENSNLPDSFFDVAVGNVPFGDFKVSDKRYDKNKFLIHDYFFAKTIDKVRPGGVIAFITSKGTLDKESPEVRKYIAQRADLLGAIRLPNNTFTKNAGTEVTSDIIFLQKRANMTDIVPNWVYLDKDDNGITMNNYFIENPDMILGNMEMKSTQFGFDSTCKPYEDQSLEESLNYAISNIHAQIEQYEVENELENTDDTIPADPNVRNYSYTIVNDEVYFRENSQMYPQDIPLTNENRIKGMIALREQVRQVIEYQMDGYSDEDIHSSQARLNELYDKFTKEYGLINSRANSTAFSNDSSYFLLCSLEKLDGEGKFVGKADIFSKRTIKALKEIDKVDTSEEALILSLSEKAKVDLDYMSNLTSKDKEEIISDLKGVIFKVPFEDKYVPADEYLSGNVREKLKLAESALANDEEYSINVEKLKEVVPKDLSASEIGIKLGATWIPSEIIRQFMFELLDTPVYRQWDIKVRYSDITSEWYVENKSSDRANVKAYSTYGTDRINAYKIIEQTLNLKDVKIFDTQIDENGNKQRVLNRKETAIAQSKQDSIKQTFQDWIWSDPDRRNQLVRIYNDKFNSIRPREYDGSHLNFVGINPEIKLRKHQVNAIAHVLYGNNVLLAHEVGAGKTFEMVASAMESKRLGLCNKSLFVVPNHIIEQFASEFLQLYPSANILVSTKKDFETKNRKKFCSRIATGDYDAVIIGHSQFEKIPMSVERQKALIEEQITDIINGIDEAKRNRGENYTIKQLEKSKRQLETRLEKLNNQSSKDDVVTFEELGVDKLFVDEAHNYKNLFLYTKMRNVGGIAQTEAQKSSDLFMKCRYLDEITGGKGTVFATGTPVSNSMVELYTMQRYLQYNDLKKQGLEHFDNWASTFGETVTAIELAPEGSGYRAKTRFAKFHNLPELMSLFKEIADIQTADTLNLPTPEVENHNIVVKPSQIQKDMVTELGNRAEKIREGQVDASVDNMLKITNEGRKLALDQRLINPLLENAEDSKVKTCTNNIYTIWENGKLDKQTQLVFCDLSTPKDNKAYENVEFSDIYNELKKDLIEKGIPTNEIAFIHEADTEAKKKELFSKVRNGDVRILIGSTQKMGAGTNVQDRLIALHHLDCPWRPSDLTQRNGRMIRQGNKNDKVHVYSYVTEGTFDAYLYQLVEQKQKFISQIMTSKTPMRTMEDIDEKALSYGEIKALATGNPKILEKTNLDSEVTKLNLLKQNFMSQKYELQDKILKYFPQEIARIDEKIAAMEYDIVTLRERTNENSEGFSPMVINNVTYTQKEDAGKKLVECCQSIKSFEEKEIGEYRGFKMILYFDSFNKLFNLKLKNKYSYNLQLGSDIYGNITRINNRLEQIEKDIPTERNLLDNIKHQLETAKIEVEKEFPQEQILQEKQKRLDELNIELKLNERDKEILGNEVEDNNKDIAIEKEFQR